LARRQGMPERTPSTRITMTRPNQIVSQEGKLRRQNSDPSPTTKSKLIWIRFFFKLPF